MSRYVVICILKNHTVYFKHASIRYLKYWRWGKGLCYIKDIRYIVSTDMEPETKKYMSTS